MSQRPPGPDHPGSSGTHPDDQTLTSTTSTSETAWGPPGGDDLLANREAIQLNPGDVYGHIRLVRFLDRGGHAEVWEGIDLDSGRRLAVKVLTGIGRTTDETLERFRREALIAASVNHENCVFVFGVARVGDRPAITMELMTQGTVKDLLARDGRLPMSRAVDITLDILRGLEAAHQQGIIHRDVKPSNCFLDQNGRAKIGDFGISKTLEATHGLTITGAFIGTPAFASPEQLRGRPIDHRSDVYSLGATLYAMLAGAPPYQAANLVDLMAKVLSEEPLPFSRHGVSLPAPLQSIILKMLSQDPVKRHQTYAEVRAALLPFSTAEPAPASLRLRIGSNLIDHGLLALRALAWAWLPAGAFQSALILDGMSLAWFLGFELAFDASPGKLLLGLRIRPAAGSSPGRYRIVVRNLAFWTIYAFAPNLIIALLPGRLGWNEALLVRVFLIGLVSASMRRANGLAGLHELASGTRVRVLSKHRQSTDVPSPRSIEGAEALPAKLAFGVYRSARILGRSSGITWHEARDPLLHRVVWIHDYQDPALAPPLATFEESAAGRLRWLSGTRSAERNWDAFEAPAGRSLEQLLPREGVGLEWGRLRELLLAAAEALAEAEKDASFPSHGIRLEQLWVERRDRVRMLDMPLIGGPDGASRNPRELLRWIALRGLTGDPGTDPEALFRIPMPGPARRLLERMFRDDGTLDSTVRELRENASRPASVTRLRKAGLVGCELAIVLVVMLGVWTFVRGSGRFETGPSWLLCTAYWNILARAETHAGSRDDAMVEAARQAFTWRFIRLEPTLQEHLLKEDVHVNPDSVQRLLAAYAGTGARQAAQAESLLAARNHSVRLISTSTRDWLLFTSIAAILAFIGVLGFLFILAARNSLLNLLCGLEVISRHGRPAPRLLCLARSFLGCVPVAVAALVLPLSSSVSGAVLLVPPIAIAAHLVLRLTSLYAPDRNVEDFILRTRLVPR